MNVSPTNVTFRSTPQGLSTANALLVLLEHTRCGCSELCVTPAPNTMDSGSVIYIYTYTYICMLLTAWIYLWLMGYGKRTAVRDAHGTLIRLRH